MESDARPVLPSGSLGLGRSAYTVEPSVLIPVFRSLASSVVGGVPRGEGGACPWTFLGPAVLGPPALFSTLYSSVLLVLDLANKNRYQS